MKQITGILLSAVLLLSLVACGDPQPSQVTIEPETSQMKAICELAVMDCYYHNVAKFKEEDAEGLLWWKKDKHFWIEYSGVVTLGIDASQVAVQVNENQISITMPKACVLNCTVDSASLNADSFIVAKDSAKVEAEDEIAAFSAAQTQLRESAANDTVLLTSAQQRAQALLEDYIHNIGKAMGKEYSVKWIYLDGALTSGQSGQEAAGSASESTVSVEEPV